MGRLFMRLFVDGFVLFAVQERIEETNFYNEHNSATSLLDQLSYLLEFNGGKIRASTPIHKKFNCSDVAVNTEENCEVRATSLEDLPGNKLTKDKHEEVVEENNADVVEVFPGVLRNNCYNGVVL